MKRDNAPAPHDADSEAATQKQPSKRGLTGRPILVGIITGVVCGAVIGGIVGGIVAATK